MDTLSESKQSAIRKMQTVRLASELLDRGYNDDDVEEMSREMLEEEWAKIVAARKDLSPETSSPEHSGKALFCSTQHLEQERLVFEQHRYKEEKEEKRWKEQKEKEREKREREETKEERERERERQKRKIREKKEEKEREREREREKERSGSLG